MDFSKFRNDFPTMRTDKGVYLDSACQTLRPDSVIEAVVEYYEKYPVCGGRSVHHLANEVSVRVDETREALCRFFNGSSPGSFVFTKNTTEAINTVAFGLGLRRGDAVVTTDSEHNSNYVPWLTLRDSAGIEMRMSHSGPDGLFDIESFKEAMDGNVRLVSMCQCSNVTGCTVPIKAVAEIAHDHGAKVLVDGSQAAPHMKVDMEDLDVDFYAMSIHKMLGPTGIGVMYGKRERLEGLEPLFYGGEMNARFDSSCSISLSDVPDRFEAGTQNMSGAMGLAEACRYIESIGFRNIRDHERKLKRMAVDGMLANGNAVLYNADSDTGIVTFNINGVFAQDAASYLGDRGVFVRSGTHCAKILPEFLKTQATVRASMYIYNDEDDVKALVEASRHAEDFLDVFFN